MQHQGDAGREWASLQDPSAVGAGDDDFTKFLELGSDFPQFDASVEAQNVSSGLDTPMSRLAFSHEGQMQGLTAHQQDLLQQDLLHHMGLDVDSLHGSHPAATTYASMQHTSQQQQQQQQQQHSPYDQQYQPYQQIPRSFHPQVPPTPVSGDLQGHKYSSIAENAGQLLFDRQQASFTPLVSPAQTPLESAWSMPDYMVADDFFSPLTSPAIEAQQHYRDTNTTSSPVDLNGEHQAADPNSASLKKSRRKLTPSTRVASARSVRQSPVVKALPRRRQASLTSLPVDKISSMLRDLDRSAHLQPTSANPTISSEDSVSPEPLTEMPPPPLPQARAPSSILKSQVTDGNAPATPSTLMRISKSPSNGHGNGVGGGALTNVLEGEEMEDIVLPAAATELPQKPLVSIDTRVSRDDDDSTPTMSAKTPKLAPDSTPRSTGMQKSANSSENLQKQGRGGGGGGGGGGGRASKKRPSVASAAISPALRPKISPSISPLVPNTGPGVPIISAETSALYLASKSNYQNILDGTHLPGVSYPETLAENLSSKRTSHKIAEQGRRNRINLALKEIESLLPPSIAAAAKKDSKSMVKEEAGDGSEKAGAGQGASKASTVEMAIVYIKSLQAELQDARTKLEAAEKAIIEGNSSGSQSSE